MRPTVGSMFRLIVPMVLAGSGCVSAPALETTLEGYQGQDESAVTEQFGRPNTTFVDQDGLTVLVYGERGMFKQPDCTVRFYVSEAGVVQRWNWSGRHCRAFARQFGFNALDRDI